MKLLRCRIGSVQSYEFAWNLLEEHILISQVDKMQKQNKELFAFFKWAPGFRSNYLLFWLFWVETQRGRILPFQRKMEGGKRKKKLERDMPQRGGLRITQVWTQDRNTKGSSVCDSERGLCQEVAGLRYWNLFQEGSWRGGPTWTVTIKKERRGKEGEGVYLPCLRCKFVPVVCGAWGEGPLLLFLYME